MWVLGFLRYSKRLTSNSNFNKSITLVQGSGNRDISTSHPQATIKNVQKYCFGNIGLLQSFFEKKFEKLNSTRSQEPFVGDQRNHLTEQTIVKIITNKNIYYVETKEQLKDKPKVSLLTHCT